MNGATVKIYSKAQNGTTKLSTNFKVSEFACKDGSDTVVVSPELVTVLQKIRDHFGRAITINSGFRNDAYNTKIGGAAYSQHKYGIAADIVVSGITPLAVAQYVQKLLPSSGGIGLYSTFTHVDVRASKSRWDQRSGKQVVVSGF